MHILHGTLLGITVWIGIVAASPSIYTVISGPLIISGVALVAAFL